MLFLSLFQLDVIADAGVSLPSPSAILSDPIVILVLVLLGFVFLIVFA
jgi:membrane-bound ClpP family serine protease